MGQLKNYTKGLHKVSNIVIKEIRQTINQHNTMKQMPTNTKLAIAIKICL